MCRRRPVSASPSSELDSGPPQPRIGGHVPDSASRRPAHHDEPVHRAAPAVAASSAPSAGPCEPARTTCATTSPSPSTANSLNQAWLLACRSGSARRRFDGCCEGREGSEVVVPQTDPRIDVVEQGGRAVVGSHVCMVRVALFVVHSGERSAVGVLHQRFGLPMNAVRTLVEQGVTEVDERQLRQTEHRPYPLVRVTHPGCGPADLVAESQQHLPMTGVEPYPEWPCAGQPCARLPSCFRSAVGRGGCCSPRGASQALPHTDSGVLCGHETRPPSPVAVHGAEGTSAARPHVDAVARKLAERVGTARHRP